MILRGIVVLVRLGSRRRLLDVRLVLSGNGGVRTRRGGTMPVVGDVVQLWTLGVHVWLLVPRLLEIRLLAMLLAILLPVLLRRR